VQGVVFTSLPTGLSAGTTQLEMLDLVMTSVQSGGIPASFSSWTALQLLEWVH
jgi:hypothetical protein